MIHTVCPSLYISDAEGVANVPLRNLYNLYKSDDWWASAERLALAIGWVPGLGDQELRRVGGTLRAPPFQRAHSRHS
jgi:hypothetical protein